MEVIKAHETVCGMTQSGKSFYAIEKCKHFDGGVLFFNTQHMATPFGKIDGRYEIDHIIDLIKSGHKIDYRPHENNEIAKKELTLLNDRILTAHIKGHLDNTLFAVDECHVFARHNDNNPVEGIATRGKGKGLYGLFITQRPAIMAKTNYALSEVKTFFDCEDEDLAYFKNQKMDVDGVFNGIRSAGKYYYVQKYLNQTTEPKKL